MNDTLLFINKFLEHGTKIASITPSSPWLSRAMLTDIDPIKARVIVELGAGTGAVTEKIVKHVSPECRILAIENDKDFVAHLKKEFSQFRNVEIVQGDCVEFPTLLKERGIIKVDHFISGLPLPSFAPEARKKLLSAVPRHLSPHGTFNQFTYFFHFYKDVYDEHFPDIRTVIELRNIPPACVFVCRSAHH